MRWYPKIPIYATLAFSAAFSAALFAATQAASPSRNPQDSGWLKSLDTSWNSPWWGPLPGGSQVPQAGTGMESPRGLGGSGFPDTGYLKVEPLWSSPYGGPATPGSGLPSRPGSGWPATGSGNGGTGAGGTRGSEMDGKGIPRDSSRTPRTGPSPVTPSDSIGSNEWMERG